MKKFISNLFSPIYKEIAGIQLKYQQISSMEMYLKNLMLTNEMDLNYSELILNKTFKINDVLDVTNIEEKDKSNKLILKINKLKDDITYLKYRKETYQTRMTNLISERIKFENEYPQIFSQFKK